MRLIVLAAVLAAPLCAVAATPSTYTSPLTMVHHSKPTEVYITFQNRTSQDRELVVGTASYKIQYGKSLQLSLPVGAVIRVFSQTNSKVNGQELMQVSESDAQSTVVLK